MKRILIIGSGGAGKTAFSLRLGEILDIEVIHLDKHYWNPGWEPTPQHIWFGMVAEMVKKDSWIMDGNYRGTMDIRFRAADTIILLDYSRYLCVLRGLKRIITNYGKVRPNMPSGCPEKFDWEFLRWIWNYPTRYRPRVMTKLNALTGDKKILIFQKPSEAERFLEQARAGAK